MKIFFACGLVVVLFLAAALPACRSWRSAEEEAAVSPPAEKAAAVSRPDEKAAAVSRPVGDKELVPPMPERVVRIPPVVEGKPAPPEEGRVVFPVPEGEDPVVVIAGLSVPRWAAGPGAAAGAVMSWDEAVKWAAGLNWLGKRGWRLPTDQELLLIHEQAALLGDLRPAEYWSSTLHPRVPGERAVVVDFSAGTRRYREKTEKRFVRAVRPAD